MTQVLSTDPTTGDQVALDFEETTRDEVAHIVRLAAESAGDFAHRSLEWRSDLLRAMADELELDLPTLVDTAARETALPKGRLEGEVRRAAFQFRFFADVVLDGSFLLVSIDHPTDSPMGPLPDLRRMHIPLGPIAVFGSSNFPFAFSVPGGDTASALAAGCPVVVKAHPAHPSTSLATYRSLTRASMKFGAPNGLLGIVFGVDAGIALVDAPEIAGIGFTGSVPAGQYLWRRANDRPMPIPFYGELGSANPLVVTPAAASDRANAIGAGAAASMTLGVGQFCTKPGLFFVPATTDGDEVVHSLTHALEQLSTMTMLSSGIAEHFQSGVTAISGTSGTKELSTFPAVNGAQVGAHLFEVDVDTFSDVRNGALHAECFGPVAIVVRYSTVDELRSSLAVIEPALTFSVFTAPEDENAEWLLDYGPSRAGRVIVNAFPTGVGVSWSMQHGGPWPSTTAPAATSVGAGGINRWLRPVTFQGVPENLLPEALRDENPLGIPRRVDGTLALS